MTAPLGIGKHALLPLNLRAKDCCWLDASYSWQARERRNGIAQSASEDREGQLALPTAHTAAAEHLQAQHRQRASYRQKLHMLTILSVEQYFQGFHQYSHSVTGDLSDHRQNNTLIPRSRGDKINFRTSTNPERSSLTGQIPHIPPN